MRGLVKVVLGVGAPILLLALLIQSLGPKPGPAPDPASLDSRASSGDGDAVELVGSPDGDWVLEADGSFLGYRVTEHYPRLRRPYEAVGRTSEVSARLHVDGGRLADAEIRADLRELESDLANRDRAVQVRYLESEDHPLATFELTEPVDIGAPGEPFAVEAPGELTIRDVTRAVRFPLEVRWDGEDAQVVGQLPIALSDFDVAAPDIPGYVTVEDEAIIEVDLHLRRS